MRGEEAHRKRREYVSGVDSWTVLIFCSVFSLCAEKKVECSPRHDDSFGER